MSSDWGSSGLRFAFSYIIVKHVRLGLYYQDCWIVFIKHKYEGVEIPFIPLTRNFSYPERKVS
jgi:hypothetical protein